MKPVLTKLFSNFFNSEKAGGLILVACTILSLLIANSEIGKNYFHFWHQSLGFNSINIHLNFSLEYWINDGLMMLFFLLIGLEIEREIYIGELSNFKNASLPIFAALGGMITPAIIHLIINNGTTAQSGFGIPMATDIAFSLGILSLLGNKVPVSLKIFLTAFAIIDDLGAILLIALFYTSTISLIYLAFAFLIFGMLLVFNRLKIYNLLFYLLPGFVMWYCMLQSGVHATVTGVLLAFAIPFGTGDENSPSYKLQLFLHKPVAFIILPIFALANTGVIISTGWYQHLILKNSLGIIIGLMIGKPIGILMFSIIAIKLKISSLSDDINFKHIIGAGLLGGIGFTMSIFITLLAFSDEQMIVDSKISVLIASTIAGLIGFIFLRINLKKNDV